MIRRSLFAAVALSLATMTVGLATTPKNLTIKMNALNGSGENGIAVLTQESDGVLVKIQLSNAKGQTQPTHIHIGTCGAISKAPEYALKNTVNGQGYSTVTGVKLSDLLAGHYAINVHKSANDLGTYVSCGNIK